MTISTIDIAARLADFVTTKITCDLNLVPLNEWNKYAGRTAQYGWLEPEIHDDRVTLNICPELMADQLRDYDETTISQYLMLVEFIIARHIVHWELDDDERWSAVEDDIWEIHKDALHFLSDMQFDILERKV